MLKRGWSHRTVV